MARSFYLFSCLYLLTVCHCVVILANHHKHGKIKTDSPNADKRNSAISAENSKEIMKKNEGRKAETTQVWIAEHKAETVGVLNNKKALKRIEKQHAKVYEGDMVTKKGSELEGLINGRKPKSSKRELLMSAKWPVTKSGESQSVIIPYQFDSSLDEEGKQAIGDAMNDYKSFTCVQFKEQTDESSYLNFKKDIGCWSYVGRTGSKQDISIGDGCQYKGTVLHEILHALGFFHEHTRPDRDNYIKVNFDNIDPNMVDNFNKYDHNLVTDFNEGYDYFSIMHYNQFAFGKSFGLQTIKSNDPNVPDSDLGQREGLSKIDVKQINAAYCKSSAATTTTTTTTTSPPTTTTTTTTSPTTTTTTISPTTTTTTTTSTTTTTTPTTPTTTEDTTIPSTTESTTTTEEPTETPFTILTLVPNKNVSPTQPITIIPGQKTTESPKDNASGSTTPVTLTPSPAGSAGNNSDDQCQQPYPCWPQDYSWSNTGYPQSCLCSKNVTSASTEHCKICNCINVKSPKSSNAWSNNYLCSKRKTINPDLKLSSLDSLPGKECLPFSGLKTWEGTLLCYKKQTLPSRFTLSDNNQQDLKGRSKCIKITEPHDWAWKPRFLCA